MTGTKDTDIAAIRRVRRSIEEMRESKRLHLKNI